MPAVGPIRRPVTLAVKNNGRHQLTAANVGSWVSALTAPGKFRNRKKNNNPKQQQRFGRRPAFGRSVCNASEKKLQRCVCDSGRRGAVKQAVFIKQGRPNARPPKVPSRGTRLARLPPLRGRPGARLLASILSNGSGLMTSATIVPIWIQLCRKLRACWGWTTCLK